MHKASIIWAFSFLLSGCGDSSTTGDGGSDDAAEDSHETTSDLSETGETIEEPAEEDPALEDPAADSEDLIADDPPAGEEDIIADMDDGEDAPWEYVRGSLASCLLNPGCNRVGINSHMGAWTAAIPGNSMAAYIRAWEFGADSIEADLRVSADGVPFMIHNDEITLYESILCAGKVVSESTAEEIDGCLLVPSFTETIPSFDEFVTWARGKIIIHLDIKESEHLAIMVGEILAHDAADFVFIAVSGGEAGTVVPEIENESSVYFTLRVGSVAGIDEALTTLRRPNIFMLEGDRNWDSPPVDDAAMMVQVARVHDEGLRMMASSSQYLPSVAEHREIFDMGFDIILSYGCENGVEAARLENEERGYPP
ncbi:MAG: glycerophosphodiester phosphodiesterase family protein [Pseudomonadota bacterium]